MFKIQMLDEIKKHLIKVLITSVSIIVSVMILYYTMSPFENCKSLVGEINSRSEVGLIKVCNGMTKW